MLVGGVDFSGAKTVPNDTWLVTGEIGSLGLQIQSVKNTGAHALAKELSGLNELRTIGMDFPFSLPVEFLKFLSKKLEKPEFEEWQNIAEALVFMNFEQFKQFADEYNIQGLRFTDSKSARVAKSPLHTANPSMIQMTFHGIRLLATLAPDKYSVLPFQDDDPKRCTIFEVYPREVLYILGLTDKGYKSGKDKKSQEKAHEVRKEIVSGLINLRERGNAKYQECPRLHIDNSIKGQIIASDHAVDALVACYCSALLFGNPKFFPDPWKVGNDNILLEGWIYGPGKLLE